MNIVEYRESNLDTRVTADIAERWQKRVVTRGLDTQGRVGGAAYLEAYGKSIGVKKCVKLACQAESVGASEFAAVIWEKAYNIETGNTETLPAGADAEEVVTFIPAPETDIHIVGLPEHLQPGKIATLQPQNADPDYDYGEDTNFVAQPKIDGHRLLAICAPDGIHYQKRSLRIAPMPSQEIDKILQDLVSQVGMVVLDGELYWQDHLGLEHRTAAQAATANVNGGFPDMIPAATYAIFDCLFYDSEDIVRAPFAYRASVLAGIDSYKYPEMVDFVHVLVPTVGKDAKDQLLHNQRIAGREGVIFRNINTTYLAGKSKTAYRVKFLTEFKLTVLGLTDTDAEGRLFGAIETALGLVGTGFTMEDQQEIQDAWDTGGMDIEIVSQGLTENGKLWHPRYVKIAEV